jgi:endonuclease/exonuclease/phosphatase family metal-dependent hydrolase
MNSIVRPIFFVPLFVWACLAVPPAKANDELPRRLTVATWNVEWFFDDFREDNRSDLAKQMAAPSAEEWQWRVEQVAQVVAAIQPTILALQEFEGRDAAYRLCRELEDKHGIHYRIAFIPGFDFGTEQQVVLLYQSGLVEYSRREQTKEMFDSGVYYNIPKHLFARFEWGTNAERESVLVSTVHFKATPESAVVRQKQARLLRYWLEDDLQKSANVISLGDFNAEQDAKQIPPGSEMALLCRPAANRPQLIDLTAELSADDRLTHLSGKPYDRILVSQSLVEDDPQRPDFIFSSIRNGREFVIRGEKDIDHRDQYYQIDQAERDISDHYPLVAEFLLK